MANELIKLYADRKVSHFTPIYNVLEKLSSNDKRSRAKGIAMYDRVKDKYETMATLSERLQRNNTERIEKASSGSTSKKEWMVDVMYYKTHLQPNR